ncbi:type VI secretion system lipoprotein TssJ [Neptuniibacter sp. SY11_33]|uniref:type VI secretion system lipoprotein TssJ n=1 Tax=Neptuniibacter sp. SY11_33 TaxID=3398215 RepID=UPI0039F63C2B
MSLRFEKGYRAMFCMLLFLSLSGCLSVEVKDDTPPDSNLALAISAHPLTNLDLSGRPSPTVVRVYQLRKEVDFKEASFFDLYDQDKALLSADLLSREEYVVAPGSFVNHQSVIDPDAHFVAVMAAFQNTDNAIHKQILQIPSQADVSLVAYLNANVLTVSPNGNITAQAATPSLAAPSLQASQGVKVEEGSVTVNPMKLEDCKKAGLLDVLVKEGC